MTKIAEVLASVFYIGYIPIVPASFGAGFGGLIYWFLMPECAPVELGVTVGLIVLAIVCSHRAEETYGHDGKRIVIDEVAGMFVSLCFLPRDGTVFVGAFLAFRVFDVLKPFPSGRLQRLPGGWGVVADDVFAGVYSNIFVRVLLLLQQSSM